MLAYTSVLKQRVSKLKYNTGRIADLPRAVNTVMQRAGRRPDLAEEFEGLEGEKGTIEENWEEVNDTLSSAAAY